jgi:hypothetical protein
MEREPGVKTDDSTLTGEQLGELDGVVRDSVDSGDTSLLSEVLGLLGIRVPTEKLEEFRDLLITRRLPLKDLEPEARKRLRDRLLSKEADVEASADYRSLLAAGSVPLCKQCRWFVVPPRDGSEVGEKSCVEMGAKGSDRACGGLILTD